eukprot:687807-Prymnesium_polylepis.1
MDPLRSLGSTNPRTGGGRSHPGYHGHVTIPTWGSPRASRHTTWPPPGDITLVITPVRAARTAYRR